MAALGVGMPFRVGMDQYFGSGKLGHQLGLNLVHDPVRFGYGHGRINPDVKLHKVMRPA